METAGVIARTNSNTPVASVNLGTNTGLVDNLGTNSGMTLGFSSNDHNVNSSITDAAGNARMMTRFIDFIDNQPMFLTKPPICPRRSSNSTCTYTSAVLDSGAIPATRASAPRLSIR